MSHSVVGGGRPRGAVRTGRVVDGLRLVIDGARSNWLWLAEISRWERALDLGSGAAAQAAGLAERFTTVHCSRLERRLLGHTWTELTADGYANIAPVRSTPVELPYRDSAFDCVTLDDVCARMLAGAGEGAFRALPNRLLRECRRVLRPGGCLYAMISNPHCWGRTASRRRRSGNVEPPPGSFSGTVPHAGHRPGASSAKRFLGLKQRLTGAGFSLVRVYCTELVGGRPPCIVPLDRRAVLAYEGLSREVSPFSRVRRFLAWIGLGRVLYPSLIYLAYR